MPEPAAEPKPEKVRKPKTTPGLAIDGGTAPAPPKAGAPKPKPKRGAAAPAAGPVVAVATPPQPEDPGWARETVQSLVAVPFLLAHLVARRQGPADAWLPGDAELSVMAAPLHNIAQRSLRLRSLARFGDGVAFVTATGTYTMAESRRIARWREAHGDDAPVPPDADLAGLHVGVRLADPAVAKPGATVLDDDFRTWRPPTLPADAP